MANAKIIGTGVYVPEKIITNDDLSKMLGEDITEFVTQNLGIYERHIAAMFTPPPDAHITKLSPRFSFPPWIASCRTIGMQAEPV